MDKLEESTTRENVDKELNPAWIATALRESGASKWGAERMLGAERERKNEKKVTVGILFASGIGSHPHE